MDTLKLICLTSLCGYLCACGGDNGSPVDIQKTYRLKQTLIETDLFHPSKEEFAIATYQYDTRNQLKSISSTIPTSKVEYTFTDDSSWTAQAAITQMISDGVTLSYFENVQFANWLIVSAETVFSTGCRLTADLTRPLAIPCWRENWIVADGAPGKFPATIIKDSNGLVAHVKANERKESSLPYANLARELTYNFDYSYTNTIPNRTVKAIDVRYLTPITTEELADLNAKGESPEEGNVGFQNGIVKVEWDYVRRSATSLEIVATHSFNGVVTHTRHHSAVYEEATCSSWAEILPYRSTEEPAMFPFCIKN